MEVVLVTGRPYLFAKGVAASIDPRVDAIGYVGNYRRIQGVAQGTPISQETALEILRLLQREHVWMAGENISSRLWQFAESDPAGLSEGHAA